MGLPGGKVVPKKTDWYRERYFRTPIKKQELSDRLNKVLGVFANHDFFRILDIGCGDGGFSLRLKQVTRAQEVYGVDISTKAVEFARANGVKAFEVDIDENSLPFETNSFDAIFCGEVIEHLIDPDHLLDEIHRVLKPWGFAIITTPNLACWYNRVALLLGFQPFYADVGYKYHVGKMIKLGSTGGGHLRLFTYRALKELLLLHNFKVVKVIGSYTHDPGRFPKLVYALEKLMSVCPSLSTTPIFIVRKGD
ncbi:MAG: 27-O-demethylrifamycin SV methyltransferase [candidate division WS2 bacterium]|nr:27-O-demethylrifamycin SV methyltransferase [Candidatus Psychracetigena formicireducens]